MILFLRELDLLLFEVAPVALTTLWFVMLRFEFTAGKGYYKFKLFTVKWSSAFISVFNHYKSSPLNGIMPPTLANSPLAIIFFVWLLCSTVLEVWACLYFLLLLDSWAAAREADY